MFLHQLFTSIYCLGHDYTFFQRSKEESVYQNLNTIVTAKFFINAGKVPVEVLLTFHFKYC